MSMPTHIQDQLVNNHAYGTQGNPTPPSTFSLPHGSTTTCEHGIATPLMNASGTQGQCAHPLSVTSPTQP